jgi:hypothetical protein
MTGTLVAPHETKSEQDYALARLTGTRFTTPAEPGRRFRGARVVPDPLLVITLLRKSAHADLRRLEVIEYEDEVILSGVVRSYYLKQMAQETVRPAVAGRRLHNKVVVSPAAAVEPRSAVPLRIVIATGNADLSSGCAERLQAVGHVVECIGSGLALLATLRSGLPDVLVVADPLPWGGADGVIARIGELGLLRQVKVIHAGLPETLAHVQVDFRDQLAAVIVGDDCTADLVARAVERVLTN